jgi:signal transduction histidine kinase
MIIGTAGLCVGFLVGGVALVGVLGLVLQRAVDSDITANARELAGLIDRNQMPAPVPAAAGDRVQVVDEAGRVRYASVDADPLKPMLSADDLARLRSGDIITIHSGRTGAYNGPVRVVGIHAGPPDDRQLVIVARSMTEVVRSLGLLRTYLWVFFPLLVIGAGLVAWRAIGAALRSVEALRRSAEEITGAAPAVAARLPVPEGRDEIHRLAVTLNGMLDRLEASRARQREFVADAAHELRSPLTNMRTQLEVAQRLGTAADWPAVSEDLLADTTRLSRLVDDLLLLARADDSARLSGQRPTSDRVGPVELGALARDVANRAASRVPVTVAADDPVWTVGDEDELRRVLANLVDNAIRYARTRVVIGAVVDRERALLTVTDDGPGIPPGDRERAFERFTRLDDSRTTDTGGAGLGLAIVRELVRRHGGAVRLADAEGSDDPSGLRVEVWLPAADLEAGGGR